MKTGLYPRLAWAGICKNRKLYLPYLLTCTGMGKRNLSRILVWEGLMVSGFALVAGLFCGILFSKLAGAYYIAVTIEDPVAAILWFFVAVIMVIAASYLLFIAGSVALYRLLQKNKSYYYRTDHFVSLSSMVYRMKRNGAGLASICILSTMVLVMISTTVCLFIGTEDSLRTRYPRDLEVELYTLDEVQIARARQTVEQVLRDRGVQGEDLLQYRYLKLLGQMAEDHISFEQEKLDSFRPG